MKKKLLIIHRALAPYRIELFNELYEAFDTRIYFEYPSPLEQQFRKDAIDERVKFKSEVLNAPKSQLKNWRPQVISIIKDFKPDIILASEFNLITPLLYYAKALYSHHSKIYVMCDDNEQSALCEVKYGRGLKKRLLGIVNGVILCDRRAEKVYSQSFVRGRRFYTYPIIQDDSFFRGKLCDALPLANDLRSKCRPEEKVILFVGRLVPEKNVHGLLQTFSKILDKQPDVRLVIVGDGPEKSDLIDMTKQLGIQPQVSFEGKHEGLPLYAYYAMADLFILPSLKEPFGAVVNEALLSGLPVICSKVAGAASLIDDSNGKTFNPYLPGDMENTLNEALSSILLYKNVTLKPSLMTLLFKEEIQKLISFIGR